MLPPLRTPLVYLGNQFLRHPVFAKCEFLGAGGSFKIRGATHLLERLLRDGRTRHLVVPSMGNTALGAAVAAREFGFTMTGVVPETIGRAKDEKLRALGVELVKVAGGGSELLDRATDLARERAGYFVHPHLDPLWTDGYRSIVAEVLHELTGCGSIVVPVGGGGLLMGVLAGLRDRPTPARLFGCEPYNYPKYAQFDHARSATIADGLLLDKPHPAVQKAIAVAGVPIGLVPEADIRAALRDVYETQGLVIEPSSAVALAFIKAHLDELPLPACAILTGENIAREDHRRLVAEAAAG